MRDYNSFVALLNKTGFVDTDYPINGCFIWLPRGMKYRAYITDSWREAMEDLGFDEYLFPRLGRSENLEVVAENIREFKKIYWVSPDKKDHPLYLTPTGESIVYPVFRRWIRQEADLPLRMFQIGSIFRPHGGGNSIINADESMTLLEGHSAYSNEEEAREQFDEINRTMVLMYERMGFAVLALRRPKYGNNPVFHECMSFEVVLPSHERSFCAGVSYYQGQIYSKPFQIRFHRPDGTSDFTYQNTFGMSVRAMMAELQLHSDQRGLQMMPEFSPEQVVVIPFFDVDGEVDIVGYAKTVAERLPNFRVHVDSEKMRPTKKLGIWRERGVPVRLGVGTENLKKGTVRVLRRDTDDMYDVEIERLPSHLNQVMSEISDSLYERTSRFLGSHTANAYEGRSLNSNLEEGLISRIGWCGEKTCGRNLEREFPGEILGVDKEETEFDTCFVCGEEAKKTAYFAKRCTSP